MITADTITDEQIRELQNSANACDEMACSTCHETWQATREALVPPECYGSASDCGPCHFYGLDHALCSTRNRRHMARAKCAEILNARAKESK